MLRILVLCYEYPPIGGGGGRVAKSVAEQLVARGHQVRVQTAALGWKSSRETLNGVEIFRTGSGRKLPDTCTVPEMGAYVATSFAPTIRHIVGWRPQVIHAHFAMPTGVLAWAAKMATRTPYVLTAHLGDVPGGVPDQTDRLFRIVHPVAREVWRHAAGATAVSSFVKELAEKAYGWPVERILNGIDLTGRPPEPSDVGRPPRLVFAGRFNPQKNAPLLIDALARVASRDWRLTMIGDGPDMPAVRERIVRHELENRVTLTGWRESEEVHRIFSESDILCMPSSSEGMPVAAVEGLKFGLAIAGSDIPGLRDVAENGVNATLAPAGDAEAFARSLDALLADGERLLQARRASWNKALQFQIGAITDQYERVLTAAARR